MKVGSGETGPGEVGEESGSHCQVLPCRCIHGYITTWRNATVSQAVYRIMAAGEHAIVTIMEAAAGSFYGQSISQQQFSIQLWPKYSITQTV